MAEIPIEDVSYEDFGLLLSTIYPKTVFPHDKTVEKLLEMADRFIMPSVIGHVEYHLLHNTKIENEKLMWMADAYGMKELLEKTVRQTNTIEKAKLLKNSPEYQKLSKDAKATVLDRIMQLI
ncbi:hypothetical protein GCK72_007460 [Caenorhabditis remanei]|uniref:BTB domain-containing protein n=1 Tax=Caenorhabditis remanei TaxID=31234 RepID=A0A6A5HK56_CAERE|nr:hypothetical protein GCK72_007458 [Caenorhabditis remanei]XP_053590415.1 hypothetical protein GCK72_007460 [Caenorhabditis remanei]KAF1767499.1 hypothetical protein GCK72_007458 [Caenorhabditis remanei]KAF1767501.1 hypothetical protein GCK72_007460 [Caenorhabditis remanei]